MAQEGPGKCVLVRVCGSALGNTLIGFFFSELLADGSSPPLLSSNNFSPNVFFVSQREKIGIKNI